MLKGSCPIVSDSHHANMAFRCEKKVMVADAWDSKEGLTRLAVRSSRCPIGQFGYGLNWLM
jgi:hypothetical protein